MFEFIEVGSINRAYVRSFNFIYLTDYTDCLLVFMGIMEHPENIYNKMIADNKHSINVFAQYENRLRRIQMA